MVHGDRRPHLVGLLVPDGEWMEKWAADHARPADLAVLANDDDFQKDLGAAVSRVNEGLSNIERVRRFLVAPDPFTIENSQMTPTMKVRRHVLREIYGEALEALYG
jgi:long-chain acyl-CoA synthetase